LRSARPAQGQDRDRSPLQALGGSEEYPPGFLHDL